MAEVDVARHLVEILAGAERAPLAGEHRGADVRVRRERPERCRERTPQLARQRIEARGAREHDGRDGTVALDPEHLIHP